MRQLIKLLTALLFLLALGRPAATQAQQAPDGACQEAGLRQAALLMARTLIQHPDLGRFHRALTSSSTDDKQEVVRFLLNEYTVSLSGNEEKERHLRWFAIKDSTRLILLRQRTVQEEGEFGPTFRHDLRISDFRYFGLVGYDLVRFLWWSPGQENFNDPRGMGMAHPLTLGQDLFDEPAAMTDFVIRGKVALLSHFKLSFSRSPENIAALFEAYQGAIYALVDREYFHRLGAFDTVERLLMARTYHDQGHQEAWMREALRHKQPWELQSPRSTEVDFFADDSWYYTFWNRRAAEGNADKVAEILRELQQHYR